VSARSKDSGLAGILLIDKASGWTSHDVVAKARRITGQRRIGHTGTLDPMATGLLVLCLGQATRLVEYLTAHEKRYTGTIRLGIRTATDDAEGEELERRPVPSISAGELEKAVGHFRGPISQVPPNYSARKLGGERAYKIARRGDTPRLASREVTVSDFQAELIEPDLVRIDITCTAGTYIRSLARDLGVVLGCGGHLASLRRERVGLFDVRDSASLEALERAVLGGDLAELLLPADEGMSSADAAIVSQEGALKLTSGVLWNASSATERGTSVARIYGADGSFVGVGSVADSGEIRALKVFQAVKTAN